LRRPRRFLIDDDCSGDCELLHKYAPEPRRKIASSFNARKWDPMKKLIVVLALVCAPVAAFADGNGGPVTPDSPFAIWQQEGSKGVAFTPMAVLAQQAHNGPTQVQVTTTTPKTQTN
jgi:hypothetical protein